MRFTGAVVLYTLP